MNQSHLNPHTVLILLLAFGGLLLAITMAESDRDWLPWLEQGPLAPWLNGNSIITTGCMMGLCAIMGRRDGSWRGIAVSCLIALMVVIQWALGQIGAAIVASHWIPAPVNAFNVLIPIVGGALCCAPLVVTQIISSARHNGWFAKSNRVDGAADSAG